MAHFTTAGKRYREGTSYASFGALDVGVTPPPAAPTTVEQTAPAELPDAGGPRKFLYWDTGRQVTNKRHVRWTFSHADTWTTWNAVAYYGVPPTGVNGGSSLVTFDAYWVGNGALDPTPVDGPGSTFVNGAGAANKAWPAGGDDHVVRTEWGPATVRALDHLQRSATDPQLDFSSLTRLIFGGDDSSVFEENDNGLSPGGGVAGIASTTAQTLTFAQNESAVILAGYVQPVYGKPLPHDFWEDLITLINDSVLGDLIQKKGDPSPEDLVRMKLLAESLELVRGERPTGDAFDGLVRAGGNMSAAELKRTIASTRAMVRRGEAAVKSLQALAAKAGKAKKK